jgi:molybdopterin-guanine dinucleotide biosynthesis protein A
MGMDKAALTYQGQQESRRVFELLGEFCEEVFLSCRAEQSNDEGRRGLPQIHDILLNHGPVSGILSAFEARPDATWLVVACDLPRLDRDVLQRLVRERHPFKVATAFEGHNGFPEPLCALYEPKARPRLYQFLAAGFDCPRKMLINSPTQILAPVGDRLFNVNTPEEAQTIRGSV